MSDVIDERTSWKRDAAEHAVSFVESGMVIGLGTGSTAVWAIRKVAALLRDGSLRDVVAVPTSGAATDEARRLGVPLTTLDAHPRLAVTIDGADEVAPDLDVIKGGGGALLHEKIVAQATDREIIVVDAEKLSPALGTLHPLPVEVVPFGHGPTATFLARLGAEVELRRDGHGQPFVTDEGNYILDARFGAIADPPALAAQLIGRAAVVEHGLFLGLTADLVIAGPGGIEHRVAVAR